MSSENLPISPNLPISSPKPDLESSVANLSDSGNRIRKRRLVVSELIDRWNLSRIIQELGTRELCIAFAEQQQLVPISKKCRIHKKMMIVSISQDANIGYFICNRGNCRMKSKFSRAKGTWFENAKIDLVRVFYIMYAYAHQWSQERVIWEDILKTQKKQCLSTSTVSDWYKCCQEAVVIYQLEHQNSTDKIGGPGKVVRINECKFGKRKSDKGKHIEGHWVIGINEDGSEDLRLEVCSENVLMTEVLVPLIKKHVQDGTIIYTSLCEAYDCLNDHGFIHKKFNHNDSDDSFVENDVTCTRSNKSLRQIIKQFYLKKKYNCHQNFADVMVEYLFRKNVKKYNKDPFIELISVIKHVYKIKN